MKDCQARLTCHQVKTMDMVNYLKLTGHHPQKIKGNDYWYLSPLRQQRTASFKVSLKLNRWYDHGMGKEGILSILPFSIIVVQLNKKDCLACVFIIKIGSFTQQRFHAALFEISSTRLP